MIKNRFLRPPLPIAQTSEGLRVPERLSVWTSHRFPSLFVALSLRVNDISHRFASVFSSIPYDRYCPSIEKVLSERICKTCGQYFVSIVILRNHIKTHQHQPSQTKLVRPVRVAARHQRETMVIIANAENVKSAEWQDEGNLDIIEMIIPEKKLHW